MSSAGQPDGLAADPANDLLWRFDPRRLSAEEVRDTILAINGSLNRQTYGPSFYPALSREVLAGQSRPGSVGGLLREETAGVYIHVKRSLLTPMMTAFDFPDPDLTWKTDSLRCSPVRHWLLNGKFVHQQASG